MAKKKTTEIINIEQPAPVGIGGQSGVMMCPEWKHPCLKNGCEKWVEFDYGKSKVARCADTWLPIIMSELRREVEKLRLDLNKKR